jgi:signal transduction histidine kinase
LAGFVVAALSARLPVTDEYRGFLDLLAGHVATAVASARAYDDERRRAEARGNRPRQNRFLLQRQPRIPHAPVFVDREMWEKIVLNLMPNAFKFTFEGGIAITLRASNGSAELRVRDTGVGVPAEQVPRLFERFHRVSNTQGRTHEGSGIGLALVQELCKLHGGSVEVSSRLGEGSTFVVSLPFGSAHLPADLVVRNRPPSAAVCTAAGPSSMRPCAGFPNIRRPKPTSLHKHGRSCRTTRTRPRTAPAC